MKIKCTKNKNNEFELTYTLTDEAINNRLEQIEAKIKSLKRSVESFTLDLKHLEQEKMELKNALENN